MRIAEIVSDRTLGLVPLDQITVDVRTYETFADIGLGEPFTDVDGNGLYDPGGRASTTSTATASATPIGERPGPAVRRTSCSTR